MELNKQGSTITLSNSEDNTRLHTISVVVRVGTDGTREAIDGGSVTSATDQQHLANFNCGRDGSGLNLNTMGQTLDTQQYMAIFTDVLDYIASAKEYISEADTEEAEAE